MTNLTTSFKAFYINILSWHALLSSDFLLKLSFLHYWQNYAKCTLLVYTFTIFPLFQHQMIHQDEKPFQCSQCNQSFTRKFNLVQHYATHTGEKPFQCSQCNKSFSQRSNLVKHQIMHTSENPF